MSTVPHDPLSRDRAAGAAAADPAAELGLTLERLASWLRGATPPSEWTTVALRSLGQLVLRGPLRITDLVATARISQPGMTSLVSRMAAAGLVIKEADAADGRATLVSATEAGVAYVDQMHELRAQEIARHVRKLPPALVQSLLDATDAMETLAGQPINPGAEHI